MNSFETDFKRAVISWKFLAGVLLELFILFAAGFDSDLFRVSVPVVCTFPYSTAWLLDYQNGFLKIYLHRTGVNAYIFGKILACGISGGTVETLAGWIYLYIGGQKDPQQNLALLFFSGMFWALTAAMLAALSNSRYLAYGGAFVVYYLLVILCERYFEHLYCLDPYEWLAPKHTWVFGEQGVILLLTGFILIMVCLYYEVLRRCIEGV